MYLYDKFNAFWGGEGILVLGLFGGSVPYRGAFLEIYIMYM